MGRASRKVENKEECIQNFCGKTTCRWEDNIKKDLRLIRWGGMDGIELA
jgi:hypothetical protein